MSDIIQFYNINNFQWSLPGAENPRLSAPVSDTATIFTVTNPPKDENENVITGDFILGCKDSNGYTESNFVPAGTLAYDAQSANFTIGKILTGGTSSATAIIIADTDAGTTGTLTLAFLSGAFQNDETITDDNSTPGSATSNGTLTNSVSSDGLTISNLVRGIDLAGLDPTTQNTSTNAVDHDQDDPVFSQVSAVNFQMMQGALQGDLNSGGASWRMGRTIDENIRVIAANGDTNEPFWEYNSANSRYEFSNDGVSSTPFGTGAGVTGGDGITVTAGDIDIDLADTVIFVSTSSGAGDSGKVVRLDASGTIADSGFYDGNLQAIVSTGTTGVTATELETLSDGSDAAALHVHGVQQEVQRYANGRTFNPVGNLLVVAASGTTFDGGGYWTQTTQASSNAFAGIETDVMLNSTSLHNKNPEFFFVTDFTTATAQDGFIGFVNSSFSGSSVENGAMTLDHFGFIIADGQISISVADGSTQSTTNVSGTVTDVNSFRATFNGTTATFYINGSNVGTRTSNVPDGNLTSVSVVVIADATNAAKAISIVKVGGYEHDNI